MDWSLEHLKLLLCSNAQFNGTADVSFHKVKVGIKVFLWSDRSGIVGSCIFESQVLQNEVAKNKQVHGNKMHHVYKNAEGTTYSLCIYVLLHSPQQRLQDVSFTFGKNKNKRKAANQHSDSVPVKYGLL